MFSDGLRGCLWKGGPRVPIQGSWPTGQETVLTGWKHPKFASYIKMECFISQWIFLTLGWIFGCLFLLVVYRKCYASILADFLISEAKFWTRGNLRVEVDPGSHFKGVHSINGCRQGSGWGLVLGNHREGEQGLPVHSSVVFFSLS